MISKIQTKQVYHSLKTILIYKKDFILLQLVSIIGTLSEKYI